MLMRGFENDHQCAPVMADREPGLPFHVGTAGWQLNSAQRNAIGRGESVLADYARVFDSVEINSTFYRSHRRETFERWADTVPAGFRFSVKVPRTITQYARLRNANGLLDAFMDEVAGLGDRLGALLVQLPPSLRFDFDAADGFFGRVRERCADVMVACEPRHGSWCGDSVDRLWQVHGITRVACDPSRLACDAHPGGVAPHYWRWHGSPTIYSSAYGPARTAELAARVRAVPGSWVIFDNTMQGHAYDDARLLLARLAD